MNEQNLIAQNYLGLNNSPDSFSIGEINISQYEDIVIEIVNRYYDHMKTIYDETKKEFEQNEDSVDYSFKFDTLSLISKRFIPRYFEFERLFNKSDGYTNDYLSELDYWPRNDYDRDKMISSYKLSKDLYRRFVLYYAPPKLKHIISQTIPITLNLDDLAVHSFTVGRSGSGKSVLVLELAKNIIDTKKASLVLIEPHGDLSEDLAKLTDPKDLIYIDPFLEPNKIPTINIFEIDDISIENISIYTGVIVDVFKQIIGGAFSPAMQSLLTPMVAVLLQIKNSSFFDMLKFLDDSNNSELLKYAQEQALNPAHRLYFKTQFLEKRASATKFSIATKLQVLLQDTVFANMLTGKSTIDLEKLINTKGKVVIIRLNTVKMTETIEPIGKFLTAIITSYAFKREHLPIDQRVMTHFFIDEAPVFLGESISVILEQARKFKLSLHLVSQNNHQLGTDINSSVLSNTSIKFVTINSNKNHRIMSSEIGVSVENLDQLTKKGEFYIKIGTNRAFKFQVSPRLLNKDTYMSDDKFEEVKKVQLEKYYRDVDLSDIQYAPIPKIENQKEDKKPYSKQTTNELLSSIESDNEVELLEY